MYIEKIQKTHSIEFFKKFLKILETTFNINISSLQDNFKNSQFIYYASINLNIQNYKVLKKLT